MNYRNALLAAGAVAALGSLATAQNDYRANWHINHNSGSLNLLFGPAFFADAGGVPNPIAVGDGYRRCYGVDISQGGRNQSYVDPTGVNNSTNLETENSWFKLVQGYAVGTAAVDIGVVSVSTASVTDLTGDACFTPLLDQSAFGYNANLGAAALLGVQGGTAGNPLPTVFVSAFQWAIGSVGGAVMPNTGPLVPSALNPAIQNPVLANVIFEVQGPVNGSFTNLQYFLGSSSERPGSLQATAPGGFVNGIARIGDGLFGTIDGAIANGTFTSTRYTAFDGVANLATFTFPAFNSPGDVEILASLAFETPALWAINSGNDGTGGPDWVVSTAPVSVVDVRRLDNLAGAEVTSGTAAFDPAIIPAVNQSFLLWSASTALGMPQAPTSWDDFFGAVPAQPGSIVLGTINTTRAGAQRLPIVFDSLTQALLGVPALSLTTNHTGSADAFVDPGNPLGLDAAFQGTFDPITAGISGFQSGAIPAVAAPDASLGGLKVGIASVGIQLDINNPNLFSEVASALSCQWQ